MNQYRSWESLAEMIRRVSSARGRRLTGLYSIEGLRLVERALRAGAPLEAVLIADALVTSRAPRIVALIKELEAVDITLLTAPDPILKELTEGRDLGAILGLVHLPSPITLEALLGEGAERAPRFIGAIHIVDPGNVGALVRTAHAGGAAALLATGASDPFHPRATRISRGSIFKLPVLSYETFADLAAALRANRVLMAGAAVADGTPLPDIMWPDQPVALLMGNEAEGLASDITDSLDRTFTIPMASGIDSYSVNAAAAIALYAATH